MITMTKWLGGIFLAVVMILALAAIGKSAAAATSFVAPTGATTMETITCNSGVSPCAINASATILSPNPNRSQCLLQNVDTSDYYCVQAVTVAAAGTASTTNMHFILKAASAANKGDGGTFSCTQGPAIFRGAIVCAGSGAGHLAASAASMSGS